MIANGQSGPYSWWESQQFPNPGSPWTGTHPEAGNGSSPHAWGMANANMVLLDSLAAQRADGSLIVGRGVPDAWVASGQVISLANFPTTDGHHLGLTIRTSGAAVTLTLTGQPAGRCRCCSSCPRSSATSRRQRWHGRRAHRHRDPGAYRAHRHRAAEARRLSEPVTG